MTAFIYQSIRLDLVYYKLKHKTRLQSKVLSLEILRFDYKPESNFKMDFFQPENP